MKLRIITYLVFIFSIGAVGLTSVLSRSMVTELQFIDSQYQVGRVLPVQATCENENYEHGERYCTGYQAGRHIVFYDYDIYSRQIDRASTVLSDHSVTLGQLVVSWGKPLGYSTQYDQVYVYWPDRYVAISGKDLNPETGATFVVYTNNIHVKHNWRGFITGAK